MFSALTKIRLFKGSCKPVKPRYIEILEEAERARDARLTPQERRVTRAFRRSWQRMNECNEMERHIAAL